MPLGEHHINHLMDEGERLAGHLAELDHHLYEVAEPEQAKARALANELERQLHLVYQGLVDELGEAQYDDWREMLRCIKENQAVYFDLNRWDCSACTGTLLEVPITQAA